MVLAEPLSTSMFTPSTDAPWWTIVTAAKGSSSRMMSCIAQSYPCPRTLLDVEDGVSRVHEVELALPVLAVQLAVPTMRRHAVGTELDHGDAVKHAVVMLGVRLERLDDEPL